MTIAVAVKVNDGIVLGADCAATIFDTSGNVAYVFNNANKISNLLKGAPIGFVSWGAGGIGNAGLETLMKDLRRRFAGKDPTRHDWRIDPENYQIADVASRAREFLFDEVYAQAFPAGQPRPALGCSVAGYSSGESMADQFHIGIEADGTCPDAQELCPRDQTPDMRFGGQSEAILRLLNGYDPQVLNTFRNIGGLTDDQVNAAVAEISSVIVSPLIAPAMPISDAIQLTSF